MAKGHGGRSPINIARSLGGIDFPASKSDLIDHAKQKHADKEVIALLDQMPDQEYASMKDVMRGVGQVE